MEGERERESVETRQGYGERTVEEELCERVNARARAQRGRESLVGPLVVGRRTLQIPVNRIQLRCYREYR